MFFNVYAASQDLPNFFMFIHRKEMFLPRETQFPHCKLSWVFNEFVNLLLLALVLASLVTSEPQLEQPEICYMVRTGS